MAASASAAAAAAPVLNDYVFLGNTGLKVSRLCLGTMTFGEAVGPMAQCSEETAHAILDRFVAAGGNFIDTADVYQRGESERILGRWLARNAAIRHKLVVATKVRGVVEPGPGAGPNDAGLSRAHIMKGVADSLARLQCEYIDLYQCHVWDDGTPVEETLRALDDLVKSNKIRYYGLSNVTGWQMQLFVDTAQRLNMAPPASLQQQYSLMCRQTEWEVVPVCLRSNVGFLPWSPLKGGWLSGKVDRTTGVPEGTRMAWAEATGASTQSGPSFSAFKDDEKTWAIIDGLKRVAAEVGGGATVAQCAIRWLMQRSVVTSVVFGAKSVAQLEDNLRAASIALSDEQVRLLDQLSHVVAPYPCEAARAARARGAAVGAGAQNGVLPGRDAARWRARPSCALSHTAAAS
jgi:aryl-alcohol dehydrogenase-like predicted oxidoreductase